VEYFVKEKIYIMQIACGAWHTAATSDLGLAFTWGCNMRGQLGTGDKNDRNLPTIIPLLKDTMILQIECGELHTVALAGPSGIAAAVFSWGAGDQAQLGHGAKVDEIEPKCIQTLSGLEVATIAVGPYHTGCIANKDFLPKVYTWGSGAHCRLGHGDNIDCTVPRCLENLDRKGVRMLAMGLYHTVCLADDGQNSTVYT